MLLGVAGPGGQFPRPVPVPHIIQGVLGIRFTHIHYTCNMQVFQLFSPVFAVFRAFLHHFPHFWPPGPTCRAELGAGTQKQGAGNHKPPGWGREKLRTGRGARPRTAQRRDGGRPSAPIPGAERRPAPEGGDPLRGGGDRRERAADRRQGSTAARAASGRGGPPQRGDALPAKKGGARAGRPPTADAPRGCAARGKRVGVVAPPRARNQPGQTLQRRPATGGARPHPAPRCRFARAQQTTHWPPAPGGRWRDSVGVSR